MAAIATVEPRLSYRSLEKVSSEELQRLRGLVDGVLDDRARQLVLIPAIVDPQLVPIPEGKPEAAPVKSDQEPEAARVLSPSQVRTFVGCSARWWFKYGLSLPEPKTSSLALGCAVHQAIETNFREKVTTKEDLDTQSVVAVFQVAWQEQAEETEFRDEENPAEIGRVGEQLVAKYMDEAAPAIQPAAVELEVAGTIGGVPVRGRVDVIDETGRVIDLKTAARKPSGIAPDYAFQLATYRQLTPGASGEARLDTLVKTKTVQLITQSYAVGEQDIRATQVLYPLAQEGMRKGLYLPNRQSLSCSRRNCAYWPHCENEYGGTIEIA